MCLLELQQDLRFLRISRRRYSRKYLHSNLSVRFLESSFKKRRKEEEVEGISAGHCHWGHRQILPSGDRCIDVDDDKIGE